ncbi:MAG: glycosyltransferase [Muribaculaceae bacterium]
MKRRVLINTHYMPIGGAERALLGLLSAIDYDEYDVDLFINRHEGELMKKIPAGVNLVPEDKTYRLVLGPLSESLKTMNIRIALDKISYRLSHARYRLLNPLKEAKDDFTEFDLLWKKAIRHLPSLERLGHYDAAISFIMPHYVVAKKVDADEKIAWIHTDYTAVSVNQASELAVWSAYDKIVAISEAVRESFAKVFPQLSGRLVTIPNIVSEELIRNEAGREIPEGFASGGLNILSVGRICFAKNFETIPDTAAILKAKGLNFRWFILGPGDSSQIMALAAEKGVSENVIALGSRENPYPYIAHCDIYVQPSRYEGNCVSVEEAKIFGKDIVVTPYPTATSQIENGVNGVIADSHSTEDLAEAVLKVTRDKSRGTSQEGQFRRSTGEVNSKELIKNLLP